MNIATDDQFELPIDYEQELELPGSIKQLKEQLSLVSQKCNQAKEKKNLEEEPRQKARRTSWTNSIWYAFAECKISNWRREQAYTASTKATDNDERSFGKKRNRKMEQEMRILNAEHSFWLSL